MRSFWAVRSTSFVALSQVRRNELCLQHDIRLARITLGGSELLFESKLRSCVGLTLIFMPAFTTVTRETRPEYQFLFLAW